MKVVFECKGCEQPCTLSYTTGDMVLVPYAMPAPTSCPFNFTKPFSWVRKK